MTIFVAASQLDVHDSSLYSFVPPPQAAAGIEVSSRRHLKEPVNSVNLYTGCVAGTIASQAITITTFDIDCK
jgi:hypothetical protein